MPARYIQPLRIMIQIFFLGFAIWLGMRLYQFVHYIRSNGSGSFVPRPDGIEAFLPISGLLGLSGWLKGIGINPVHPAALVVLLTVLAVSLLLRRSFCSWICPVATMSELLWKTGFKLFRRNIWLPRWLDITVRGLKYLLLSLFVVAIVVRMDAASLRDFIFSDYHKIADVRLLDFFLHIAPLPLGIILFLLLLSLLMKNAFCRFLCPYGALLGLAALFSPVRVTRDPGTCVSCGVCSQACPTRIDVMAKSSVNTPECIGCWRCIAHCRAQGALSMRLGGRIRIPGLVFALLVVLCFWGGTAIGKACGAWHTAITPNEYRQLLEK